MTYWWVLAEPAGESTLEKLQRESGITLPPSTSSSRTSSTAASRRAPGCSCSTPSTRSRRCWARVEADTTIAAYSDALEDFLHGLGACRGVIASREFRGPARRRDLPTFVVVPLTWQRKPALIEKADLPADVEQILVADLEHAGEDIRALTDNPMFLGLLCENARSGSPFPESAHRVIESHVQERFERDRVRIQDLFAVEPDLHQAAQGDRRGPRRLGRRRGHLLAPTAPGVLRDLCRVARAGTGACGGAGAADPRGRWRVPEVRLDAVRPGRTGGPDPDRRASRWSSSSPSSS